MQKEEKDNYIQKETGHDILASCQRKTRGYFGAKYLLSGAKKLLLLHIQTKVWRKGEDTRYMYQLMLAVCVQIIYRQNKSGAIHLKFILFSTHCFLSKEQLL